MESKTKREAVIELINKLFFFIDSKQWDKLVKDIFKEKVLFNMSSSGEGQPNVITAKAICEKWREEFKEIDHVHHQVSNFIVDFKSEGAEADIFCYGIQSQHKHAATLSKTRELVGSYDFHASFTDLGWRLDAMRFSLKFINGNAE